MSTPTFRNARSGRGRARKAFRPAAASKWANDVHDLVNLFAKKAHPTKTIGDHRRSLEWLIETCLPPRASARTSRLYLTALAKLLRCLDEGSERFSRRPDSNNVFVWLNKQVGCNPCAQVLWIVRRVLGRFHLVNLEGADKQIRSFVDEALEMSFTYSMDGRDLLKTVEAIESYVAACTPEFHRFAAPLRKATAEWIDEKSYFLMDDYSIRFAGGVLDSSIDALIRLGAEDTARALRRVREFDDPVRASNVRDGVILSDNINDADKDMMSSLESAMGSLGVSSPGKANRSPVHRFDVGRFLNVGE